MEIGQDFKEFIGLLNKHKVEYLVVGGYAVSLYGFPRYTGDIDFWIKPSELNSSKIISALIDFGFGTLDVNIDDFNKEGNVVQLGYPPNRIDIITSVSGLSFDNCWSKKETILSESMEVNYISLHHLRINKQITGRDKDLLDLKNLPKE